MTGEQILLQAIARVPSHAVFAFDAGGTVLTWNEGVRRILGFEEQEFLGSNADTIFTPEDRALGEPERERTLARQMGMAADFRWHLRKDGTRFWANGAVQVVRDEQGNPAGYVKIARDATFEKEMQDALQEAHGDLERRVEERTRELLVASEQLRRSEDRFFVAFREAPMAIALTTLDDRLVDVNEAFERVTGRQRSEVLGQKATSFGLWASPTDQQKLREARAAEQGFRELELQIRTADGRVRDIISSAAVVEVGETPGLVKMFVDMTERKRTERQLTDALREVMQDASWLSNRVMEKLVQANRQDGAGPELSDLTARERAVLECIAQGKSNQRIGEELKLAPSTVRNYVTNIYGKIQVESRAEAVVWARERGLGGY
jgi:PAS domain S-box-containing protein